MSFAGMGNIVNKILFFIFILHSSCVAQKTSYTSLLITNSIFAEEEIMCGFLKKDVTLQTPYGKIKVAADGGKTGYPFDFSYYKENNNLEKIWLKEEKTIIYDNMLITLPVFECGKLTCVVFYDNFNIRTCRAKNTVTNFETEIPADTAFHFNKDGTLRSFTLYQDWFFENNQYLSGKQFRIVDGKIVPWK